MACPATRSQTHPESSGSERTCPVLRVALDDPHACAAVPTMHASPVRHEPATKSRALANLLDLAEPGHRTDVPLERLLGW